MTQIAVKDANGATQNLEVPNANGQQLMAASRPVVIASNQSAIPVNSTIVAAIPAGANVIGGVTQSGTWNITNISGTISLPTGAATAANQTALNALFPSSIGKKAAASSLSVALSNEDSANLATIATNAADTTTPSPVKIDQTTDGTTNLVRNKPDTSAHALIPAPSTYRLLSSAASTNGANIKASAGTVKGIQGYNAKASAVYLKLYNKATAPTVGTDTPVKTIYLPATTAFAIPFYTGLTFSTGISIALTGAGADADTTALASGDILGLNVDYH